jgi:predicted Zn-dependent protease
VIFLRKLPNLKKFDFLAVKNEAENNNIQDKKNNKNINDEKKFRNNFSFLKKKDEQKELFSKAEKFFDDKKYKEAEKIFIKLIANDPQNVKYYNRLGVIYMEDKNYQDAKDAFYEAVNLDPKKAARHYNYAMACIELGEFRYAIESLNKAVRMDKKNEKYKKSLKDVQDKVKYRYKEMKREED